jgi:hypothetical protein
MIGFLKALGILVLRRLRGPRVATTTPPAKRPPAVEPPGYSRYLEALTRVDPGLTVNTDRAVRRGQRVAEAHQRYEYDTGKVLDYTRREFDGGNASVDAAKAAEILAVVLRHLPA